VSSVAGVDGGGTLARAVLLVDRGAEVARGEAAGAVASEQDVDAAAAAVARAVRAAAARGRVSLPVKALHAGLAGAGREGVRAALARALEAEGLAERTVVATDVEAAFQDAFGDGPGILLIAGTGSIAWARDASGKVVRAGGWGERLGDEGSGFAIGTAALRAVARADDGRGPMTSLHARIPGHFGVDGVDALVGWAVAASKADVAALVPLVVEASRAGDEVAGGILDRAAADLVAHVEAVLDRSSPWPGAPELVLWGGLLRADGPLRDRVVTAAAGLRMRPVDRTVDPALGAARLALASLGGRS
jgi:N-acetylglucosamine kinase-like BadF-type ATPase